MTKIFEPKWVKWVAGVVAPILAAVFDPCLFKGGFLGQPFLLDTRPIAYAIIFSGAIAIALRLWTARGASFAAGMLSAYAALAYIIGICLLPLSFIGISFHGLGVFGLLPFGTAAVLHIEASACFARHKARPHAAAGFCMVVIFLVVFHIASTTAMRRAMEDMKTNSQVSRMTRITAWATISLGFETRCMLHCGRLEPGPERARLAAAYSDILGVDLEQEIRLHWD